MSAQCTKTAWLSSKLKQFALDEEIYLNYIESVLDGEEDRCEKISALEAILGEVLVSIAPYVTSAIGQYAVNHRFVTKLKNIICP